MGATGFLAVGTGAAIGLIDGDAALPPEIRQFVVTGFMGGLTTFSTFSVAGSLALTALGFLTVRLLAGA